MHIWKTGKDFFELFFRNVDFLTEVVGGENQALESLLPFNRKWRKFCGKPRILTADFADLQRGRIQKNPAKPMDAGVVDGREIAPHLREIARRFDASV